MRRSIGILLALAVNCAAQDPVLRGKSELVLVPVTVVDRAGHYVRSLDQGDLILLDDNVPQRIQLEESILPISLVVAVQTTPASKIILDKLRKASVALLAEIKGARGSIAVVDFGHYVRIVQPFTSNDDEALRAVQHLEPTGAGASIADAMATSFDLLAHQPKEQRRILLVLSEKHDLSSNKQRIAALSAVAQQENVTVYSVTFSPTATQWTDRVPKYCDPPPPLTKCARCTCGNCGNQCDREDGKPQPYVPTQIAYDMNLGALFGAIAKAAQPNFGEVLARSTGGKQSGFATKSGLDKVLEDIGRDIHGQYLLSFQPAASEHAGFHQLRVEVKGRNNLTVRTRPVYWNSGAN
jgi:hypothetical protein